MIDLKVYCFGDSHSWFFRNFSFCESISMGPHLAYNFINQVPTVLDIMKNRDANDQVNRKFLLFCFGEIDVRVHLKKKGNIEECAKRYLDSIQKVKEVYPQCIVFGTVASSVIEQRTEFPTMGTCPERNRIAKEFNSYLCLYSSQAGVSYFDVLDKLVDESGMTRTEYYKDDGVHLSKEAVPLVEPQFSRILGEVK